MRDVHEQGPGSGRDLSPGFGSYVLPGGGVRFRLWAPACRRVDLLLDGAHRHPMRRSRGVHRQGWFVGVIPGARPGTRYRFVLEGGASIPDPASRCNPDGVAGDSEVVDPTLWRGPPRGGATVTAFGRRRREPGWTGRPWHEAVICEVHVGTFTSRGTLAAAASRLPELAGAGFTAVQLMPVAAFAGERGWGYDGALPMAPHAAYGRPEDLVHFIEVAHRLRLMVLGDLVLNHLGPQGNPWPACAGGCFERGEETPWGRAPAFDGPHAGPVRRFFIEVARHWVDAYGLDGLRLDAVHAIRDASRPDIVEALTRTVREVGARRRRWVHVVLENDANEAWRLGGAHPVAHPCGPARDPGPAAARGSAPESSSESASGTSPGHAPIGRGGGAAADAQWNDDFQHAAHVILTGERHRHLADVAAHPHWQLARALAQGFGLQGECSPWRGGGPRGQPSDHLPPTAFINFLQTHDVVGNRVDGLRLAPGPSGQGVPVDPAALRALTAVLLLSPSIPLLFMGQAWWATTPFLYFCDFDEPLASAVAAGRRREFADDPGFAVATALSDPGSRDAFVRSRLDWSERDTPSGRIGLALTRRLVRLRQTHLVPRLAGARSGMFHVLAPGQLHVQWPLGDGAVLHLLANLHPQPAPAEVVPPGRVVWQTPPPVDRVAGPRPAMLHPWHVRFSIDAAPSPAEP